MCYPRQLLFMGYLPLFGMALCLPIMGCMPQIERPECSQDIHCNWMEDAVCDLQIGKCVAQLPPKGDADAGEVPVDGGAIPIDGGGLDSGQLSPLGASCEEDQHCQSSSCRPSSEQTWFCVEPDHGCATIMGDSLAVGDTLCVGNDLDVCTGAGEVERQSCSADCTPYLPVHACDDGQCLQCPQDCNDDIQCVATAFCSQSLGQCVDDRQVGEPCLRNRECLSRLCAPGPQGESVCIPGCLDTEWNPLPSGISCDDRDPCTHNDTCDGSGTCAGIPYQCHHGGVCDGDNLCVCAPPYAGDFCLECQSGFDMVVGQCLNEQSVPCSTEDLPDNSDPIPALVIIEYTEQQDGLWAWQLPAKCSFTCHDGFTRLGELCQEFAGGDGSVENPYQVFSAMQLNRVRHHLEGHFVLMASIDLDQDPLNVEGGWEPIGSFPRVELVLNLTGVTGGTYILLGVNSRGEPVQTNPILWDADARHIRESFRQANRDWRAHDVFGVFPRFIIEMNDGFVTGLDASGLIDGEGATLELMEYFAFTGSFDGNGLMVSNLTIHQPLADYVGMFGSIDGGEVRDLSLIGVNVTGNAQVGGLAGHTGTGTALIAIHVSGTVDGVSNVGGLVGQSRGSVSYSRSDCSIGLSGGSRKGGLVGENRGPISLSFATGPVLGGSASGGLVGQNHAAITNSYASGPVSGTSSIGGLVGTHWTGSVNNCHCVGSVTGSGSLGLGGLVGRQLSTATIEGSFALLEMVTRTSLNDLVGRVVGSFAGPLVNNYALSSMLFHDEPNESYSTLFPLHNSTGATKDGQDVSPANAIRQATYQVVGWDFVDVWTTRGDSGYPRLQWED